MKSALFIISLLIGILIWGIWVIVSHPQNAIVSWDEGFHGGAALFISKGLRNNFDFKSYSYILNDFKNGIIWYLPLWWGSAGLMGAIFNTSVEIYRLATLIFSALSIALIGFFCKRYCR